MNVADIVVVGLVAVAFAAVVVRMKRKGVCADCADKGSCGSCGHCSAKPGAGCPAAMASGELDEKLRRGL